MTRKIVLLAGAALAVLAVYVVLRETGLVAVLGDEEQLRAFIEKLGPWGALAIIGLEAAAIVASPLPSAPIAMVAGAAYGPVWGTVYTVIGAEIGALVAFGLARYFGYGFVRRWANVRQVLDWLEKEHSQRWLMAVVFASRLIPFISFDAISYAAGLTPLALWRFAIATFAGVIPIAFLLVYTGDRMLASRNGSAFWTVTVLGAVTLIPIAIHLLRRTRR